MQRKRIVIGIVGILVLFFGWSYLSDLKSAEDLNEIALLDAYAAIEEYKSVIENSKIEMENLQSEIYNAQQTADSIGGMYYQFSSVQSQSELDDLASDLDSEASQLKSQLNDVDSSVQSLESYLDTDVSSY